MRYAIIKSLCFLIVIFLLISFFYSLAEASIVLKVIAVNPSKQYPQKVSVKTYLPKETKPEDVVDRGDLEIAYDTQQGSYYVYGEYELKPGEVVERDVEIRDIWLIPDAEIESLRSETVKLEGLLKNTEFAERISFLKNSIESKLNQIAENQKNTPPNPERHISDYREHLKILESVKADLALARSFLSQVRPLASMAVWRLIIIIIVFLGVLGATFYFIWQRQVKVITKDDTFYVPEKEESGSEQAEPERRQAEESESKSEPTDIEKILGEEEKPKET